MVSILGRGLFWRVYLTLLTSLVLVAVLSTVLWHALAAPAAPMRMHAGPMRMGGDHMLVLLMGIAAAVGLAAAPVVSRLTRRLERLRESLEAWGAGGLSTRAKVEGRDEIAAVAASFNAAADQVEALLAAHRDLLAHASHELRSPLARLRIALEMFAQAPDPALRPAIVADIAELDGLVEEILLASRLDHTPLEAERGRIDLLGLAAEEAARAGVGLSYDEAAGPPFAMEGSTRLLRRLIRNIVDNATRHGAPPVEIVVGRSGADVTVAVRDHGGGIGEAERERIFEPFYRPGGRGEAAGNWGLGLSIVRQIARRHGGEVSWRPGAQGGGAFVVVLPAAPDMVNPS